MQDKWMRFYILCFLLAFGIISIPNEAKAQAVVEETTVYTQPSAVREIIVTGMGKPPQRPMRKTQAVMMARRAAMIDGYNKILKELTGGSAAQMGVADGVIHRRGFLRGVRVLEIRVFGSSTVQVDMSFRGPGSSADGMIVDQTTKDFEQAELVQRHQEAYEVQRGTWEDLFKKKKSYKLMK